MSKEKGCKCCNQIWYVDMLDKKLKLCPNCYEYCKPLFDDLKIKDKQIADLQHRLSNCIEPKFKVGQEIYILCEPNRIISGWKIADYEFYKSQYIIEKKDSIDWIHKDRIFATKEEAEARLKELKGEKK